MKQDKHTLHVLLFLAVLLCGWGQSAHAQSKLIHIKYGPIPPKAGEITNFAKVELPKSAPAPSQIRGCTSTTFNGLSAPVDVGGSYIIFNVPLVGGALFSNVICSAASFDKLTTYPSQATLLRYGEQLHLRVVGTTAQSEEVDVSGAREGTTYTSSTPTIAEVDAEGVITARASGTTTISIKQGSLTNQVTVTVTLAKPLGIVLRPARLGFSKAGESQEVKVLLIYPDAFYDATSQVKFTIDTTQIASITNTTVTALKPGKALLTATVQGLTAQALIDVAGTATLTALKVAPTSLSLQTKGEVQQLQVTGTYSDQSTLDLTGASSGIQYASSAPSIATVSADGAVEALANGSATITIQHPALAGTNVKVSVTVQIPNLLQLTVTPNPIVLRQVGQTAQLTVTGEFSGGSQKDVSANKLTTYLSQDPTIATVSATGLVTAVKLGSTSITVSYDGKQAQVPAQIAQKVLSSIAFSQSSLSVTQNAVDSAPTSVQLKVTGTYDDQSTGDLTKKSDGTTYNSSQTNVATVDQDGKLFAGSAAGQTIITATNQTKTTTLTVTVTRFTSQALARLALPGTSEDTVLVENIAYVAAGDKGLHLVDVSTPNQPKLTQTLEGFGHAYALTEMGNYLLLSDNKGALHFLPNARPQFLESVASIALTGGTAHGAAHWQDRLFVAGGKAGVAEIRVTQMTRPVLLGMTNQGDIQAIAADSRWVVAVDSGSLLFYDHQVASWWTLAASRTIALAGARRVISSGSATPGTFYVAAQDGVYRIDETGARVKLTAPGTILGRAISTNPRWLAAAGKFFGRNEAALFTLNQPLVATYGANFPFATLGSGYQAEGVRNRRGYLFMALGADGLQIGQYRLWFDLDTVAPTINLTSPLDNQTQPETADLHFVANANDDREVNKVEYRLNNQLIATQTTRPFRLSYPAPDVTTNTALVLEATAYDMAGTKTSSKSITVNVTPVTDTQAPTLQLLYPAAQDEVEIGQPMIVRSLAQDDQRVAEVRLFINGTQVERLLLPPYTFSYTIPANTPVETKFQVEVEAVDYGGLKTRSPAVSVVAVKLTPLTADIGESDTSFDNQRVVVRGRTIAIDGSHRFKSLWVDQGGILTHSAATTTKVHKLIVDADYIYIGTKSKIDVTAKGYLAAGIGGNGATGRTFGNATTGGATFTQGGAHGGPGGYASTPAPPSAMYDAMFHPLEPGGGAGACSNPNNCSGGGVVRLMSKVIRLDGRMIADGGGKASHGGAGGSVYLSTDALSGNGEISADGGGEFDNSSSPGAGGRVAVYYKSLAGFSLSSITARGTGGSKGNTTYPAFFAGGTGTILTKGPNDTFGILTLDHDNPANAIQATPLPQVGKAVSTGVTPSTITQSSANWEPGQLVDHWVNPNTQQSKVYRITANTKTSLTLDVGGDDLTTLAKPGDTFHGVLFLDALVLRNRAQISTDDLLNIGANNGQGLTIVGGVFHDANLVLDPNDDLTVDGGQLTLQQPLSVKQLTLRNGAILSVIPATTTAFFAADLTVAQTLSIDATSQINVTGKGYRVGNLATTGGAGYHHNFQTTNGSFKRAGGSHGGLGEVYFADAQSKAGPTFGRFEDPIEPGGGGSCISFGSCLTGHGGGLVKISAGTLQLGGKIIANGEPGDVNGGGGAGGGVKITTNTLSGTGSIEANGGNAPTSGGYGAGAGGRIAIDYTTLQGFDLITQLKANPGVRVETRNSPPGAGTIYTKAANQTYGELHIAQNGFPATGLITPLLAIGRGTITALLPNQLTDSNATFDADNQLAGLWLNPDVLNTTLLKVMANNPTNLFTRPVDGSLTTLSAVGKTYQGILQLDALIVSGGARVSTLDELKATTVQVDPTSAFSGRVQKLPACPVTCQISQDCQVFGCGTKTVCLSNQCQ